MAHNNPFISPHILLSTRKHIYSYPFNSHNVVATLFLKSKISSSWIIRMTYITRIIHKLQRVYHTSDKPFFITIIPTSHKKLLPSTKHQIIGIHHCNSGATIFSPKPHVYIWRKEELEKVIIHEFIHFYNLDSFSKSIPVDFQEAYTESLATVWYTKNLKLDYLHRISILAKLLIYFYGTNFPSLSKPFPSDIRSKISKKTSVLGYYWITAAILFRIYTKKIDFKLLPKSSFYNFAKNAIRDPEFHYLLKSSFTHQSRYKINRSLRMTF